MSSVAKINSSSRTYAEGSPPREVSEPESVNQRAHVLAIASGKGGVGKTSLSTNLSIALSQLGSRVCLFDADTSLANVNILLNIHPKFTLEHFISEGQAMDEVLVAAPGGVDIVPGATGVTEMLELSGDQQDRLLSGLRSLESKYDYLVIDTAAGVDKALLKFLAAAPTVILTITHEPTSLTDAFSLLKVMKKRGIKKPVHVIVNLAQNRHVAHSTFKRFKGAVTKYLKTEISYLGFVFADTLVSKAVTEQHPFLLRYQSSLKALPNGLSSSCPKMELRAVRFLIFLSNSEQGVSWKGV